MALTLLFLSLAVVSFILFFTPFKKFALEKKRLYFAIYLAVFALFASLAAFFGVRFALEEFLQATSCRVILATLSLFLSLYSLMGFFMSEKSLRIAPRILLFAFFALMLIFLGYAFYFGRVSLDNETDLLKSLRSSF